MTFEAFAKVNLSLEVLGLRKDGYHEIRSIVQPIAFSDSLDIIPTCDGVVSSDSVYGDRDLAVRAAQSLRPDVSLGARIGMVKRIPVGSGLGGGSADAAAVLLALNSLWRLGRTLEELAEVGASVGSDVPALVFALGRRRPVLMEGRGERVRFLGEGEIPWIAQIAAKWLVLANPGVCCSTAEVYARFSPNHGEGDSCSAADGSAMLRNDLLGPACELHPEIGEALSKMRAAGAENVAMSGSGATVFGLADDKTSACRIRDEMKKNGYSAWCVRTL